MSHEELRDSMLARFRDEMSKKGEDIRTDIHSNTFSIFDTIALFMKHEDERMSLLTATGEDLDRITSIICPRQPVPLRDGEEAPPYSPLTVSPPDGSRWETDQELRERLILNMTPVTGSDEVPR